VDVTADSGHIAMGGVANDVVDVALPAAVDQARVAAAVDIDGLSGQQHDCGLRLIWRSHSPWAASIVPSMPVSIQIRSSGPVLIR
jgi:hypothetical protein